MWVEDGREVQYSLCEYFYANELIKWVYKFQNVDGVPKRSVVS